MKSIRVNFLAGLAVLLPIFLTIWLLWKAFLLVDGILSETIRLLLGNVVNLEFFRTHDIPGLGFVAVMLMLFFAGMIARNFVGRKVISGTERVMSRIPLANKIYNAISQIARAFFSDRREVFQKAVLVQYPKDGMYSIAFFTQDTHGPVQDALPEDVISVFLPSTPNPTTGFLLFVPKSEVIPLNLSVEEALKLVISGGAIVPKSLPTATEESLTSRAGSNTDAQSAGVTRGGVTPPAPDQP
jgi:uncharacterized membrane protein